jgi:hypothetical protein
VNDKSKQSHVGERQIKTKPRGRTTNQNNVTWANLVGRLNVDGGSSEEVFFVAFGREKVLHESGHEAHVGGGHEEARVRAGVEGVARLGPIS